MFRFSPVIRSLPRAFVAVNTMKSPLVMGQINNLRSIHHTIPRTSAINNELVAALQNEIDAEKQLEQDNLGGSSTPTIPGFTIKTDGAEITLTKTSGAEKVYISFNVNHSITMEDGGHVNHDDDFEGEGDEHEEPPMVPIALPPFSVEIIKGEKRLCFELKLVESDGDDDFQVDEFYIAPGPQGADVKDNVYSSSGQYIDPNLHDLLFIRYLEEHGLNRDFCQSLANFTTHYEHTQYVNLLKNIKDFIGK